MMPSRLTLPCSTTPPMRKVRSFGALAAATSDGEKKNTRLSLKAFSSSVVHTPSTATPPAISAMRL